MTPVADDASLGRGWAPPAVVLTALLTAIVVVGAVLVGGQGGGAENMRARADAKAFAIGGLDVTVGAAGSEADAEGPPVQTPVASTAFERTRSGSASAMPAPSSVPTATCTGLVALGPVSVPDPVCTTLGP